MHTNVRPNGRDVKARQTKTKKSPKALCKTMRGRSDHQARISTSIASTEPDRNAARAERLSGTRQAFLCAPRLRRRGAHPYARKGQSLDSECVARDADPPFHQHPGAATHDRFVDRRSPPPAARFTRVPGMAAAVPIATAAVPIMAWCSLPIDNARTFRSISAELICLPLDAT